MVTLCRVCKRLPVNLGRSKSKCTECLEKARIYKNERSKLHRNELSKRQREYYQKNKDKCVEYAGKYRKAHLDKFREYNKKYYENNKDKHRQYAKSRPEKVLEWNRRYREKNEERVKSLRHDIYLRRKDKALQEWRTRRARILKAEGSFSEKEWKCLLELYGHKCLKCGTHEDICADHVVPISRGGSNSIENIQPLCRKCNGQKGTKTIDFRPPD